MIKIVSLRRIIVGVAYGTEVLYVDEGQHMLARFNYTITDPAEAKRVIEAKRAELQRGRVSL